MANLVPGFLFRTPGLNRSFTSISNPTTPKDHEKINGRVPDPGRHFRASCTIIPHTHRNCYDSVSLYIKPGIQTNIDFLSSNNQRSHTWCPAQTAVNQKRHTSCKVPIDPKEFIPGMLSYTEWQHRLCTLKKNRIFNYPEMPPGAKLNLCYAERIYSSRNLLEQKRKQYMQLLIQKNRGLHSTESAKYMRYVNQSKTGPLPSKTGWSRPERLPNLVNSMDSTKDNNHKQRTPDEKTCPSSEVLQKSQSGQFKSPKPKSKKEIKLELEKHESTKQRISIDQRVTGNRNPNRSRPSFLSSRNDPARSQTSSRSRTQSEEDINLKDEPKDAIETGIEAKVHEKLQEEDQKLTDVKQEEAADKMDKMSKVHDSRPSTVLSIHKHVERPESGMSTSSKAVLSVLGHVEIPESEKFTLSKGKGAEAQMNIDYVEDIKSKSGNKAESLVSIRSNDSQQIYRAHRDMVDEDTDAGASKDVHRERRDSGGEDSRREGNKEIHHARSNSEEAEDDNGERRGSQEIYGARRDSVETEDERGDAKRDSGEIHRVLRDSEEVEDDKGEARRVQRESDDEMNRKSQEYNSRPLTVERPETGKTSSREVHEKLQEEDQKSTDFEQRESADELNKKSQEHDSHPPTVDRPDMGQKVSNTVHETLKEDQNSTDFKQREPADEMNQRYDLRPSTVDSLKSGKKTSNKVQEKLQEKDQKSKDFDQAESADEMKITSQRLDPRLSAVERPNSGKSTSSKDKSEQTQASTNEAENIFKQQNRQGIIVTSANNSQEHVQTR